MPSWQVSRRNVQSSPRPRPRASRQTSDSMSNRSPFGSRGPGGFAGGLTGPIPTDLWILLGTVLFTLTLGSFDATRGVIEWFRLTPWVWLRGFLWQLATYPFVGEGGFLFLLTLLLPAALLIAAVQFAIEDQLISSRRDTGRRRRVLHTEGPRARRGAARAPGIR